MKLIAMVSSKIFLMDSELISIITSIIFLLFFSHLFGFLFSKLKLPRVVGEITGGIILGPSCLGLFSVDIYNAIFNSFAGQGKILSSLYWLGLILLMYTAGFNIKKDLKTHDKKIISFLLISATLLPCIGGYFYFKTFDFMKYAGNNSSMFSLLIIVCVAISVTSIPVISKIFIDLGIIESHFARIVLSAATIQDIILWGGLSLATQTLSKSQTSIIQVTLSTVIFVLILLFIGPYILKSINKYKTYFVFESSPTSYFLLICLFISVLANILSVNIVFGAFISGIISRELLEENFPVVKTVISRFSLAFFIPIYFAIVGLKINLPQHFDFILFFSFITISSFLELTSVFLGMLLIKLDKLSSFNFAMAMNTRGGPGIVLASIAYEYKIINEEFFVTLVLVAIITSLISGAWFQFLISKNIRLYKINV